MSTGRWKLLTKHKTLLRAVEPLQQGKTRGRLGTTDRSTHHHKKTEPCNLRSCESSRQNLTKIVSTSSCSSKSLSRTCLPAWRKRPLTGSRGTQVDRRGRGSRTTCQPLSESGPECCGSNNAVAQHARALELPSTAHPS